MAQTENKTFEPRGGSVALVFPGEFKDEVTKESIVYGASVKIQGGKMTKGGVYQMSPKMLREICQMYQEDTEGFRQKLDKLATA